MRRVQKFLLGLGAVVLAGLPCAALGQPAFFQNGWPYPGYRPAVPLSLAIRACMRECERWYGPCNDFSDIFALECKVKRDHCEAGCYGK